MLVVISCGIMMKKLKMFMQMFIFVVGRLFESIVQGSDRIDVQVKFMLIIEVISQCGLWIIRNDSRLMLFSYRFIRWFMCSLQVCISSGMRIVVSMFMLLQVFISMFVQFVFLLYVVEVVLVLLQKCLVIVGVVLIYIVNMVNQEKNCIQLSWCIGLGMLYRLFMIWCSVFWLWVWLSYMNSVLKLINLLVSRYNFFFRLQCWISVSSIVLSLRNNVLICYVLFIVVGVLLMWVLVKVCSCFGGYLWVLRMVYSMVLSSIVVLVQNVYIIECGILLGGVVLVMLKWVSMQGRNDVIIVLMLINMFCIVQFSGCCFGGSWLLMKVWNGFIDMLNEVFMIYSRLVVIYSVGELGMVINVMVVSMVLVKKYGWCWLKWFQVWLDR